MTSPIGRRCTGSLMLSASLSSDSSPRSRLLAKPRARTNACACGSRSRRRRDDNKRWKRCEALRREKSHSNRWIPTAEMGRRTHHRARSAQKACAAADPPARLGSCGRAGRRPRGWRRRCSRCRDRGVRRPKPSGSSGRGCRLLPRPGSGAPVHRATGRLPRPTSDHPATIAEGVDHPRRMPPLWPPPALTAVFCPPQPAHVRELGPADGVEKAMLRPDRHSGAENPVRGLSCGEPAHPSCSHLATAARQRAGGMQPKRQRDVVAPG